MHNLSEEEMYKCISEMVEDGILSWDGMDENGEPMLSLVKE